MFVTTSTMFGINFCLTHVTGDSKKSKVISCGTFRVRSTAWEGYDLKETETLGMYLTYKRVQKLLKKSTNYLSD